MMKLVDASSYFDRTAALDPDTGEELFKCQVDPFDDSKREAGPAYRRILSVRPGTSVPVAIRLFGQVWLVGTREADGLEEMHREKYVLQRASAKALVYRLDGFLATTLASSSWAALEWEKDAKEIATSSNLPGIFRALLPAGYDARVHDVIVYEGYAYLVLETHPQPSGFAEAGCVKLEANVPVALTIRTRVYSPVAGTYTTASSVTVQAMTVRWQSLFVYGSQADARFQDGDFALVVSNSASVTTASALVLGGKSFNVLSIDDISGCKVLHTRPA